MTLLAKIDTVFIHRGTFLCNNSKTVISNIEALPNSLIIIVA